jgi:predicted TIM-barrel fold metal-dependent hydrolase
MESSAVAPTAAIDAQARAPARRLITADNHLTPPPWLANELPAAMRDTIVARSGGYEERDGQRYLIRPQRTGMMAGAEAPAHVGAVGDPDEAIVKALNRFAGVDCMPWFDPKGRLHDMRRENIAAAVLIGVPAFGLTRSPQEVEAQVAYCHIVNDWQYDTYKDFFNFFATGIYLPFLDPAACVVELERCARRGMRPGVLPDYIHDSPYRSPEWEPLWEAASALKVPLTLHISGLRHPAPAKTGGRPDPAAIMTGFYSHSAECGATLAEFAITGLFQKYPDLHIVMTEGAAFWLAGLNDQLDHYWESRYGDMVRSFMPTDRPALEMPPSHFIKRQGHATFMWDPVAIRLRDLTGLDSLIWGNDYPHTEGSFPYSQDYITRQFAGVPEAEIEQITFGNAARLFRFDV